jgi:FkbM family methyltransferase
MSPKIVFDVGMNNGDDTAYYLHKGFNVVAVEANPQLVDNVKIRFREEIRKGRLTILNVGITDEEGIKPFWVCDSYSYWSSFHRGAASNEGSVSHEIPVSCRRLDSVLEEFGVPYYLKVDIEQNERYCIDSLKKGPLPEYVSFEGNTVALVDMIADLGYTRFKCISQHHYLPLELPSTSQQKRYEMLDGLLKSRNPFVRNLRSIGGRRLFEGLKNRCRKEGDWSFPWGSSGPFGESLPGRWLNQQEMRTTIETFREMMSNGESSPFWTDKQYSFWNDIHATH